MNRFKEYKDEIFYGVGILLLVLLTFLPFVDDLQVETEAEVIEPARTFPSVTIVGQAGIVKDLKTGEVLYAKNKNEKHPLASLTKVMSSIVAREYLGDTALVSIEERDLMTEGDSGLFLDELWESKELLGLTLLISSNDGSSAIKSTVESSFNVDLIEEMNKKAEELGLSNTYYLNESGLDVTDYIGGSYGSAEDTADLLGYAVQNHYDLFGKTKNESATVYSLNYGAHTISNTNVITNNIPSLLAGKTGFTDLAGGNLAVVFEKEPGHPIAVVVLGSTKEDRFTDVEELVWATFKY